MGNGVIDRDASIGVAVSRLHGEQLAHFGEVDRPLLGQEAASVGARPQRGDCLADQLVGGIRPGGLGLLKPSGERALPPRW